MGLADRGWAGALLTWEWHGLQLQAEISRAKYFVRGERHEAIAWCELRDVSGGRRCDIGSFRDVSAAKAACELHAQRRVSHREKRQPRPVSVAIAPGRRRAFRCSCQLAGQIAPECVARGQCKERRPPALRRRAPAGDLGDALACWADVLADED